MLARSLVQFALIVSCAAGLACDAGDTEFPEPNLGNGDFRVTVTQTQDGVITTSELIFHAPDSWQTIADPVLGDVVIVGIEAWRRIGSEWQPFDGQNATRLLEYQTAGFKQRPPKASKRVNGPQVDGESTSTWTFPRTNVGEKLATAIVNSESKSAAAFQEPGYRAGVLAFAREVEKTTGRFTYLIGNDSGRVFEASMESDGNALPGLIQYVVHYEPTTILPP